MIFALAAALRIAFVAFADQKPCCAYEVGRVAEYIVQGDGFVSPFGEKREDPSVHSAPLSPFYLAGIYWALGTDSDRAGAFAMWLNVLYSALSTVVVYFLGLRVFRKTSVALMGATAFALCPASFAMIPMLWGTCLLVLGASILYLLAYRLRDRPRWRESVVFGSFAGLLALYDIPLLLFSILAVPAALTATRAGSLRRRLALAAAAYSMMFAITSPWLVRDFIVTGRHVVPIRGCFGISLWAGNYPGAREDYAEGVSHSHHPLSSPEEAELLSKVGEYTYNQARLKDSIAWMSDHRADFLWLTGHRIMDYWAGPYGVTRKRVYMGLMGVDVAKLIMQGLPAVACAFGVMLAWRRRYPVGLLVLALAVVPLPYYVTTANPRYRHPLDPVLYLFAGYACTATFRRWVGSGVARDLLSQPQVPSDAAQTSTV
jgi:hypothetical protein